MNPEDYSISDYETVYNVLLQCYSYHLDEYPDAALALFYEGFPGLLNMSDHDLIDGLVACGGLESAIAQCAVVEVSKRPQLTVIKGGKSIH
jgi:hypothetical protein